MLNSKIRYNTLGRELSSSGNVTKIKFKIKSLLYSRYYTEACSEWRVYLRGYRAPGQYSSEEMSQRW